MGSGEKCQFGGCCLPGGHKYACRDKSGRPLSLVADKNEAAETAISQAMYAARKAALAEKAGYELSAPPPALAGSWGVFADAASEQVRMALIGPATHETWDKAQTWMNILMYCIDCKDNEKESSDGRTTS